MTRSILVPRPFFIMDELPDAGWTETILLRIGFRTQYLIEGDSMLPTLKPGEHVLVDVRAQVGAGDIVVAGHPYKRDIVIVKRIKEIDENGNYFLISDNLEESTDSRSFGAVSGTSIIGKVVSRLS